MPLGGGPGPSFSSAEAGIAHLIPDKAQPLDNRNDSDAGTTAAVIPAAAASFAGRKQDTVSPSPSTSGVLIKRQRADSSPEVQFVAMKKEEHAILMDKHRLGNELLKLEADMTRAQIELITAERTCCSTEEDGRCKKKVLRATTQQTVGSGRGNQLLWHHYSAERIFQGWKRTQFLFSCPIDSHCHSTDCCYFYSFCISSSC